MPDDLLEVVQHQLKSTCERLVWMLDPDVLSHAERLLQLLIVLNRLNFVVVNVYFMFCISVTLNNNKTQTAVLRPLQHG